jgi:aminodeoxyfutalosine deaminase
MKSRSKKSLDEPNSQIDVPTWLRHLPKVELHLHLEGSTEPETLVALSRRHDAHPLTLADARALYTYKDFLGFMDSYKAMSQRLRTPEDYELITYNMVRALAAQGIVHAEVYISFGILHYWHKVEVDPYMEAIERARVRAEAETGTTLYWLIDAVRHFGAEEAARVFRKAAELRAKYPSIIGIGIGGDEARGPASLFKEPPASASPPTPASQAAPSMAPPASGPPSTSAPNVSATASPRNMTPS